MSTLTINPTLTGNVHMQAPSANGWRPATLYSAGSSGTMVIENVYSAATYADVQSFARWDTSALAGKTVTGATLHIQVSYINYAEYNLTGAHRVLFAQWYDPGTSITQVDYAANPSNNAFNTGGNIAEDYTGGLYDITLSNAPANINTTGYTGLRFAMAGANPPTNFTVVYWVVCQLVVTYIAGGSVAVSLPVTLSTSTTKTRFIPMALDLPVTLSASAGLTKYPVLGMAMPVAFDASLTAAPQTVPKATSLSLPVGWTVGTAIQTQIVPKAAAMDLPVAFSAESATPLKIKPVSAPLPVGYTYAQAKEAIGIAAHGRRVGSGWSSNTGLSGLSSIM